MIVVSDPSSLAPINRAWTDYVPTFAEQVTGMAYADDEVEYKKCAEKIPLAFERVERALEKQGAGPLFNGAKYRWSMPPMRRSFSAISSSTASSRSA